MKKGLGNLTCVQIKSKVKNSKANISSDELRELREEILDETTREEKKEAKIIFDGKQYSIRFPKKFIKCDYLSPTFRTKFHFICYFIFTFPTFH